jgi:hypothetical protein
LRQWPAGPATIRPWGRAAREQTPAGLFQQKFWQAELVEGVAEAANGAHGSGQWHLGNSLGQVRLNIDDATTARWLTLKAQACAARVRAGA